MKRKVLHPEPSQSEQLNGPKYWRSLDEMAATPGFKQHVEREFPEGASNLDGVDRRQFFKLMAASFALGGVGLAAGCRRPEAHILPYGKSVEGIIPGLPLYFATAMPLRKYAIPVLAGTHQGRPTKLEGNASYAPYGGGTNAFVQASVLDLYDPDRATTHTIGGAAVTNAAIQDKLAGIGAAYVSSQGAGLAFLAEESASPTRAALIARLKAKFPAALWSEYEPTSETPALAAGQAAFGKNVQPHYQFASAKRIVSLDADFFHSEAGSLYYSREFTKGRRVTSAKDDMNRLYVVESGFTLTGGMADHRLRLASSHMLALAGALAAQITGDSSFAALAQGLDFKDKEKWIQACAQDLRDHAGQSLVVAGAHLPAEVQAVVYAINVALGNVGKTVDFLQVEASAAISIKALADAIKAGSVKTLVVLGGNPVYNAPSDLNWASLQKSVPEVVRHGYYVDETSLASSAHVGATHYLESWGDARTADGTIVAIQPMILPLFSGLTELEVLARIAGETTTDAYTMVYQTITGIAGGEPAAAFRKFLHDGVLAGSGYPKASVNLSAGGLSRLINNAPKFTALSKDNLEVRFTTDQKVDDGRFANNGWLQECPDPITKISWDNAILISPRLAGDLGIAPTGSKLQVARVEAGDFEIGKENARLAEITIGGRTIKGPLHIQPGLSNYTIVVPLGYGRTVSGRVGKGQGFDAYPLRTSDGMSFAVGASIKLTGERYRLANTQEHWSMEGRDIVREGNLDEYKANPGFVDTFGTESHSPAIFGGHHSPENDNKLSREERAAQTAQRSKETPRGGSLYETPDFKGIHQWGMAIDLNTCIGCNACIIACQAENNIPIVGKDQVLRGREMHWIRLDRYYSDGRADAAAFGGDGNREIPEDPQVSLQPIACQHCELAPCETVCPVNATVHDDEGINGMAYNRCIGTRYCANNCPYKVRRFNFFDWNKRQIDQLYMGPLGESGMPELVKMVKNPDVTVRMRGVMEKCTYCIQRIQQAKIAQKIKAGASGNVKIPDGTIKVACQQACPIDSIYFGDISDPTSEVSKAKTREQDYSLLGYLNIRPRTTFLAKLRNPNPEMPDYALIQTPYSRQEYQNKNHPSHGEHGHDHESHEAGQSETQGESAHTEHGHTSLQNLKRVGGLS